MRPAPHDAKYSRSLIGTTYRRHLTPVVFHRPSKPKVGFRCDVAMHRQFSRSLADLDYWIDRVSCGNHHRPLHVGGRASEGQTRVGSTAQVTRGRASLAHPQGAWSTWFPHKTRQQDRRTNYRQDGRKPVANACPDRVPRECAQDWATRKGRYGRGHSLCAS